MRRLTEAVLMLAAEQDITQTSVAELTRKAGINRSTFYAFAASPMELLTSILHADLDIARRETAGELVERRSLTREIMGHIMARIVDHVERYQMVYTGTQRDSSRFALRIVLAEHVEQSVLQAFKGGFINAPVNEPGFAAMFASFVGHGIAGATEVWAQTAGQQGRSALFEAVGQMWPIWFAPETARQTLDAPKERTPASRYADDPREHEQGEEAASTPRGV